MATTSVIPLYGQALKITLNITSSYTTILPNAARGRYYISLAVSNSFSCLIDLNLQNTIAECISRTNCNILTEPFNNNILQCQLYDTNSDFILQYQYNNNNLNVKTIQGGTLNNCAFVIQYVGRDMPAIGTSIHAIDQIQASTGSIISFSNDITGGNSTFTNFINITSITGSFQLNSNPIIT